MSLTKYEQEVIINFNAEEGTASVYAANPVWIRKMDKLVNANPEEFKLISEDKQGDKIISKRYQVSKNLVSIRTRTTKRILTEEQKEQARKQLQRINAIR